MAGTSAGAKKGWETRRRGKASPAKKATKAKAAKAPAKAKEHTYKAKLGKSKTSISGYVFQDVIVTRDDGEQRHIQVTMREGTTKGRYGQRIMGQWIRTTAEAKADAIAAARRGQTYIT